MFGQCRSIVTWVAALAGVALLWPAAPARADSEAYFSTELFPAAPAPESEWTTIQAAPGIKVAFPYVAFGATFVPLPQVCVDGALLAVADPRVDPGVRVSAETLRAQVQAAADRYVAEPSRQLAGTPAAGYAAGAAMRYPVDVYHVVERGILRQHVFLYRKLWPIPTCASR